MGMDHLIRAYLDTSPCNYKGCSLNKSGECSYRYDMTLKIWRERIKCGHIASALRKGIPFIKLSELTIEDSPLLISSTSKLKVSLATELLRDGSGI